MTFSSFADSANGAFRSATRRGGLGHGPVGPKLAPLPTLSLILAPLAPFCARARFWDVCPINVPFFVEGARISAGMG